MAFLDNPALYTMHVLHPTTMKFNPSTARKWCMFVFFHHTSESCDVASKTYIEVEALESCNRVGCACIGNSFADIANTDANTTVCKVSVCDTNPMPYLLKSIKLLVHMFQGMLSWSKSCQHLLETLTFTSVPHMMFIILPSGCHLYVNVKFDMLCFVKTQCILKSCSFFDSNVRAV